MWNSRPPPLNGKSILNFHFDYFHPSLRPSISRSGLTSTKFTEKSVINYKQGGHGQ